MKRQLMSYRVVLEFVDWIRANKEEWGRLTAAEALAKCKERLPSITVHNVMTILRLAGVTLVGKKPSPSKEAVQELLARVGVLEDRVELLEELMGKGS